MYATLLAALLTVAGLVSPASLDGKAGDGPAQQIEIVDADAPLLPAVLSLEAFASSAHPNLPATLRLTSGAAGPETCYKACTNGGPSTPCTDFRYNPAVIKTCGSYDGPVQKPCEVGPRPSC